MTDTAKRTPSQTESSLRAQVADLQRSLDQQHANHACSQSLLQQEVGRLQNVCNELTFAMVMHGVSPSALHQIARQDVDARRAAEEGTISPAASPMTSPVKQKKARAGQAPPAVTYAAGTQTDTAIGVGPILRSGMDTCRPMTAMEAGHGPPMPRRPSWVDSAPSPASPASFEELLLHQGPHPHLQTGAYQLGSAQPVQFVPRATLALGSDGGPLAADDVGPLVLRDGQYRPASKRRHQRPRHLEALDAPASS